MVSVGSVVGTIIATALVIYRNRGNIPLMLIAVVIAAVVITAHLPNIRRIMEGRERRLEKIEWEKQRTEKEETCGSRQNDQNSANESLRTSENCRRLFAKKIGSSPFTHYTVNGFHFIGVSPDCEKMSDGYRKILPYLKIEIELAKKELFYSKARRHGRTVCTPQIMYREADSCKLLHSREKHIEYIA